MIRRFIAKRFGERARLINAAWLCVLAAGGLSLIGIYTIELGNVPVEGVVQHGLGDRASKQAVFVVAGLLAAAVAALQDYRKVRLLSWVIFVAALGLLLVLVVPFMPHSIVRARHGVRAWIDLGPVDLQPTELVKIAWIMVTADYLRFSKDHRTLRGLIPPAALLFVPAVLIMLQPDLGSVLLFVPTLFAILVAAGMKMKHLGLVVVCGALAVPASYPLLRPYQQQRIVGMIHQLRGDTRGSDDINYQSVTAISLVGSGEVSGYSENKARAVVRYAQLPEQHNDMIYAVFVARFGFLGALGLLGLYAVWAGGALLTAGMCKDPFGRLICVGFAALITVQMLVNLGMVVGVLPIIGVTLPFVSYGGSSMLSAWLMTGLIFSVAARRAAILTRPTFEFND